MATNYEILMSLTRKQMSAFINSLVNKEVSRYIDWNAWLVSEDPEPPYIGEAAFLKENEDETACYLLEEKEENGLRTRTVFMPGDKGSIITKTVEAHFVRKQSEPIYPAAPLPELSEEEMNAVADESDFVLESLLDEAEKEADALDAIITSSMDAAFEETQPAVSEPGPEPVSEPEEEPEPAAEPEPEPVAEPEEPVFFEEVREEPEEIPGLPLTEEDDEILAEEVTDEDIPDLILESETSAVSDLQNQQKLHELLFDDEEQGEEIPDIITEEPAEEKDEDLFDSAILEQLENEVMAADKAEDEAASSIDFDELIAAHIDEAEESTEAVSEPEAEKEEDEVVDFFDERDREAAENRDYYSRGRIEMLKESLFDDEDEPPVGTGDLVFQETTAIEIDPAKNELPEAADLDDIGFAEVKIPEEMIETAEKAESTSSLELGEDEDADTFFERFKELTESEPDADATNELDLEEIKKQSSILSKMAAGEEEVSEEPEKTPEEAERDFRSDTLAQLLIDKKKLSMLYDPNDPEDQELPTIAFSALNTDEEQMF